MVQVTNELDEKQDLFPQALAVVQIPFHINFNSTILDSIVEQKTTIQSRYNATSEHMRPLKKVRDLSVTSLIRLWQHETPLSFKKLVIKGVLKALMAERAESSCERGKQLRDDKRWALWERRFIISISMRSFAASEFNSGYRWTPIWKQLPATCGVGWGGGTDPLEEAPAVQMNLQRARRTKCKNLLASMHRASAILY